MKIEYGTQSKFPEKTGRVLFMVTLVLRSQLKFLLKMKTPLVDKLVHYLMENYPVWKPKGEILLLTWKDDNGKRYMADTVSRKLREAEESKRIAVKSDGKKSLVYKWLPLDLRNNYIPTSERKNPDVLFVK